MARRLPTQGDRKGPPPARSAPRAQARGRARAGAAVVPVRVSVHAPGGKHYSPEVSVLLRQGRSDVALRRPEGSLLYEGRVPAGRYDLVVSPAAPLWAPAQTVDVAPPTKSASVYLGEKGWPSYPIGGILVPFAPRDELIGVVSEHRSLRPDAARVVVGRLRSELGLEPAPATAPSPSDKDTTTWVLRRVGAAGGGVTPDLRRRIQEVVGHPVRVGVLVDPTPGQLKILDNRYLVRFRDGVPASRVASLLADAKARRLRTFPQAPGAILVEFTEGSYPEHLRTIETWTAGDLLLYAEAHLIAEVTSSAFPASAPNDPKFPSQKNLVVQGVPAAWKALKKLRSAITLGSPEITVATIDEGIQLDHKDIGTDLTDGRPQLAPESYDFMNSQSFSARGYVPYGRHGMGVYGIIAAATNNGCGIAGIAPNTHHLGIMLPNISATFYPDVLMWAAGFTSGNTDPGWPPEPIARGADIISCSHTARGTALSILMDLTLRYLTDHGRGGRGTVVVYAAGNDSTAITGWATWAAHPCTLAVSNSDLPDAQGVERLHRKQPLSDGSNYGLEIDLCAQGEFAPSLNDQGGYQEFSGTSAAAPTVAAAAALMLSANPDLTWTQVRDLLRNTATQIDPANTDPIGLWSGGFSQWYGHGRLTVDAAVEASIALRPPAAHSPKPKEDRNVAKKTKGTKGKKGKKGKKVRASAVDPFTFAVKTVGLNVVEVEASNPDDVLEELDDPTGLTGTQVTLTKTNPYSGGGKRWHVIGTNSAGQTQAWKLDGTKRKFKVYVNKGKVMVVKDGNSNVPPEGGVPAVGTVYGSFLVCEGPEDTTCWYVVQGGVAYRICR